MMDAEMYGMMPSAKSDMFSSAPPENRLMKPTTPPWPATYFRMMLRSTPGVVTKQPMRYTASMKSV